jgi:hypothetical protein
MNLSRLQVVLNHDDPNLVSVGLSELSKQILLENNCIEDFGYMGRSLQYSSINGSSNPEVKGLLSTYIKSSPQIEEFFLLWDMPGIETNKQFCLSHISCLSAILFCTRGSTFAEKIANRIISDYSKSLISSLSSSNTSTVHSTLGLLIALSRVSSGIAKNVYSNIVKSCSILNQLLQKGKSIPWEHNNIKISTDSRYLIALLVFVLLRTLDADVCEDFLSNSRSLFFRVLNGQQTDPLETKELILRAVSEIVAMQLHLSMKCKVFDRQMIRYLASNVNSDHASIEDLSHNLLVTYANILVHMYGDKKAKTDKGAPSVMVAFSKELSPHLYIPHRQVMSESDSLTALNIIYHGY